MSLKLLSLFAVFITLFNVGESGRLPVRMNTTVTNVVCPDQGQCPDGDTCCELESGDYGCCPLPDAVCCPDKETCCPHGTTCNGAGGCSSFQKQLTKINFHAPIASNNAGGLKSLQSLDLAQKVADNENSICPDPQWQCPGLQTCCLRGGTTWVCCPYALGVCCPGGFSCCPHNTACDTTGTRCYQGDGSKSNSLMFIQSILTLSKEKK